VTGLFLNDRLERVDQRFRKAAGTLGRFKQAEGKKAVDALAVPSHHEGPFRIAAHAVFRLGRQRNAISGDEIGEHVLVATLLEGIEFDRLA